MVSSKRKSLKIVGILYVGVEVADEGAHDPIQVSRNVLSWTAARRNNWSPRVACFMNFWKQIEF